MTTVWVNKPPSKEAAKELLSMSLEDKVWQTATNIGEWDLFTGGRWYISFSGGKDSTVLAYIAAKMMNNSPVPRTLHLLFCDTGLEYPEIRRFVVWFAEWLQKQFPRVEIDLQRRRPKKHFFDVIREKGYPIISKEVAKDIKEARSGGAWAIKRLSGEMKGSRYDHTKHAYLLDAPILISHECCVYTKKQPGKAFGKESGSLPMTAEMAMESQMRYSRWLQTGCNGFEGKTPKSKPMSFWTNQNVLQYKLQEGIPFCSVYGDVLAFDGENYYENTLFDVEINTAFNAETVKCLKNNGWIVPKVPSQNLRCTGCQRTGCVFCGFGAHLEKSGEQRFVLLKETHPKHWNYAINGGEWDPVDGMWKPSKTPGHIGLGMGRVLDYIGVPYE